MNKIAYELGQKVAAHSIDNPIMQQEKEVRNQIIRSYLKHILGGAGAGLVGGGLLGGLVGAATRDVGAGIVGGSSLGLGAGASLGALAGLYRNPSIPQSQVHVN